MKYIRPLTLHFISFRYVYLFYWFVLGLVLFAYTSLFPYNLISILLLFTILSTLLSIGIGIYEYQIVRFSYLSLKVIRPNFFVSSIIFGLIHTILLTITYIGFAYVNNALINQDTLHTLHYGLYGFLLVTNLTLYVLGNGYSLFFGKKKIFQQIFILVIIVGLVLFARDIIIFVQAFSEKLFLYPEDQLFLLAPIGLLGLVFIIINYLRFNVFY